LLRGGIFPQTSGTATDGPPAPVYPPRVMPCLRSQTPQQTSEQTS